jgi:hypothetical protein
MANRPAYAPDWTYAQCEAWIAEEIAGQPVERPMPEHDEGECDHCDRLRELQRVADERA